MISTAVTLTTTSTAMQQLKLNREQVDRLVRAGLLPVVGSFGRTRLLDPAAVGALACRQHLPTSRHGRLQALAVHLGPLVQDPQGDRNQRHVLGWDAHAPIPKSAWEGWWNTGPAIADAMVDLPLLPSVSGFVVTVREVVGWTAHPVDPGLVRFNTRRASSAVRRGFQDTCFRVDAGAVWQRIYG